MSTIIFGLEHSKWRAIVGLLICVAILLPAAAAALAQTPRMNVLLIISDDMRAELGCYGSSIAKTPALDALAESGVLFERAYCQFPLCNPSRSSMLTGRRPTNVGVLGNRTWFGATCPAAVSLVEHFRNQGYVTLRAGKIFHGGLDDTAAWTEGGQPRYFGEGATAAPPEARERASDGRLLSKTERSDRWIVLENGAEQQGDHRVADAAIEYLRRSWEKPFFLAVGFRKPHSPLAAPKEFFDKFQTESIPLPPDYAPRPTVPAGFPAGSIRPRNADLFVGRDSTPESAREMIRAYLASSAWMDWNVGRVLDELEAQQLSKNTLVVFWGDHGFQLGEKGKWSKAGSLWEQGTRTPLIIRDPRMDPMPKRCPRIVEAVDIFPTLCDLCDLPAPAGVEGRSLAPLLQDPAAPSNRPAYTVWSEDGRRLSGVCVRIERYRFVEFFGRGAGKMLTDSENDPHELVNLADRPEHADLVARLSKLARNYAAGWLATATPASE